MKKQLTKTLLFSGISFIVIFLIGLFLIFFSYKYYTSYVDNKKLKQYSLNARLVETANTLLQTIKERKNYKNYIKSLNIKSNDNILDFGAGFGNEAVFIIDNLDEHNGHLICIDINEIVLNIAKKRLNKNNNVSFICGDINKIDLKPNSSNKIILYNVLHAIDKIFLDETLRKLLEILEEDGKIYIREPEHHGYSIQVIRTIMTINGFVVLGITTSKATNGVDAVFVKNKININNNR